MLKPMELNVTAPRSSGLGTKSPTEACQAGALSAVPQPIRKVKPSNSQGVSTPDQAQNASAVETTSMNPCAQSMTTRRSRLSASAPDQSERSMIGKVLDEWTSATSSRELVSDVISQAAPTDWLRPPTLETKIGRAHV